MRRLICALVLVLVAISVTGCSKSLPVVGGTVKT
jgi:hypothetical protein